MEKLKKIAYPYSHSALSRSIKKNIHLEIFNLLTTLSQFDEIQFIENVAV